ncbi:MAG: hypothetical protein HQL30_13020 [Candidatus Omnitrophica bacterium]|nr:hypothetical protein [Candidatus Omnitrophota bacterium]
MPLAWPAARQAVAAANDIFGIKDKYKGTSGTSIVKVFALTAGMSGMSEKALKITGIKYGKVYTHPANHAGYYPGASEMAMKLLFDENSGKVLGVQVIGGEGVDKRIDVIAMAIKHGLTVKDLADSDLAYAPPYGSAKDPVNLVGMVAVNHMSGISPLIHWGDLDGKEFLLDVRTRMEFAKGSVSGAVNIPVDDIRENLSAIPKDRNIAVFCQVGIRGHAALRILKQHGYNVKNLSGGYLTYIDHKGSTS